MEKTITDIKAGKNPKAQRSNLYLDGKFAFSLDNEVILKEGLKVGRGLSEIETSRLSRADGFQKGLNAAFRFLSYRPRSEAEIRERLTRQGHESQDIEEVIAKLKQMELVNDTAFAEFWKDNRNSFKPRSQRMVKMELRRKGVDVEVINEVVENIDDAENAYQVAISRARRLPLADYQVFRQRLGSYLQRRGFAFAVINNVVKRAWEECRPDAGESSEVTPEAEA